MRRLAALALLLLVAPARAERLPIRTYGAGEGLAGDLVRCVVQDSRGFLWLATNAGVSRFDGATFTNFGAADGVPFGSARKIVEAPDGTLYVVARGRVVRFDPSPPSGGKAFSPLTFPELARWVGEVLDLAVAPDGALVMVGTKGAARLQGGAVRRIDLGPSPPGDDAETAWGAAFDVRGALWVARTYVVTRIAPGGDRATWMVPSGQVISSGWGWLPSMVADRRRGVWVLTTTELWHLATDPSGRPVREEIIDKSTGLPSLLPRALHETAGGAMWIATPDQGLIRCEGAPGARRFTRIGTHEGLPDTEVTALTSDAQENLWAGTGVAGLVRVAAEGMTSWGPADGLTPVTVQALHEDPEEGLVVILADLHFVSIKGSRVVHRWTPAPPVLPNWGEKQLVARGRDGRLWLATGVGLAVYPPGTRVRQLETGKPERVFDTGDGLPGNAIQRLFVASDGTVWFGIMHAEKGLCRMDGQGNGLRCFGVQDGLPPEPWAVAFEEDLGGGIWFGLWNGGLFRHRQGRIESWPETVESVQTGVSSIRRDASGGLWVSGAPGLLRVEDPASPHPTFRRLSGEQGISSSETTDTAEDPAGRLYVGSAHGVTRVDLATGATRRFTVADGLPSNRVTAMQWDGDGALWIGTSRGVARLVPRAGAPPVPPRVFLTSVTVAGTRRDPRAPLALEADERTIEFAFTSPSFRAAETMRFQWRLLDTSDAWSPPGTSRSVVFAGLSPGRHRFEVRTVDGDGRVSTPVATEFSIRPPLWRRGWFLGLVALAFTGAIAAVHRTRVRRLLEVERVRTRIATDLHDDVAASLSQIAVLSQTASRQAARGSAEAEGSLERITDLSGSVVDAMSDVVWSINPARDRMSDLVHRMRRFAVDLFSEADAELQLELPEDADDARIDSEVRRQVYLVFKESLRNAVRHAAATRVEVSLHRQGRGLLLTVRDNGRGLGDARATDTGFGLQNMRRRAEVIGATLAIRPVPGGGTEVLLDTGTD